MFFMGYLEEDVWCVSNGFNINQVGAYDRPKSLFRDFISYNHSNYKPEVNRYHLYVSYACPWAHRTLIMRHLKQLHSIVSVSVVMPDMLENGWEFGSNFSHSTHDHINQFNYLYEVYKHAKKDCTCRVTVPVLFDKKTHTIVNNESSDIIRIFNSAFNEFTNNYDDYYPQDLSDEIDNINEVIYHSINNGVYKVGFAQQQAVYDEAVSKLFNQLDYLEEYFKSHLFLVGNKLTEADIRLVPTLLRFDSVYHTHFKCNQKQLRNYSNLYEYVRKIYDFSAVKETTFYSHIIRHYYYSHNMINPFQIIPVCPNPIF